MTGIQSDEKLLDLERAAERAGGVYRLAKLLGWGKSTLYRKLNAESPITRGDALEIREVMRGLTKKQTGRKG